MRLVLFLLLLVGLLMLGARSWLAVVLAAVLAMGLSYILLRDQRDQAVEALIRRRQERGRRHGVDETAEDIFDEQ
ncbi:MAG: hypothetical protein CSA58_00860 [Micrococcales bacterium]|nr:MAG: hypothetical protein CSB46_05785 [Micrococcales bacterium]PIE25829.1 MAG: hypothetical protein CSA58_12800 [Micrococcales bacterium]PIE28093.1 MAG: hypothetical protein CSA58_00860 [Micrococcales bacterium]